MGKSVKTNFTFNIIHQLSGIVFPIITFPYITRVVMAEGIGIVQFYVSILNYVMLLAALGIPLYAVREVAKYRDDIKLRNKTTIEILALHLLLTFIGYIVVFIIAFSVNKITDVYLFLLLSVQLILNAIGANWFFEATEQFKFITIRSLIVKLLCIIMLFTCVKTKDDLYWYAGVTIASEVGNYLWNFISLNRQIDIRSIEWKSIDLRRHIKPALNIFALNLIVSIYVNLDSVMLGMLTDNTSVGFYSTANRLAKMLLCVSLSLGTVLLPRLSAYYATGNMEAYNTMVRKAKSFMVTLTTPMAIGLIAVSSYLIPVFCGDSFEPSIRTLQILSPIIFVIGLSNLMGTRILYSQGKEKIVILSTLIGAITNFGLNLVLIPSLMQDGAAVATLVAETLVTLCMYFIGKKYFAFSLFDKEFFVVFFSSIIMCVPIYFIDKIPMPHYMCIIFDVVAAISVYATMMFVTKNNNVGIVMNIFRNRIK